MPSVPILWHWYDDSGVFAGNHQEAISYTNYSLDGNHFVVLPL